MSLQLPFGVRVLNASPVENKYFSNAGTPYTSVSQANTQIASGVRHIGLTVNINNVEYWYENGILDNDLVIKIPDVAEGGAITGATNGLTKVSNDVILGGELNQSVALSYSGADVMEFQIDLNNDNGLKTNFNVYSSSNTGIFNLYTRASDNVRNAYINGDSSINGGLDISYEESIGNKGQLKLNQSGLAVILNGTVNKFQYDADYSANFTPRSLVDKQYVDNLSAGLDPKAAVKVATTTDLGATYNPTGGISGTGSFSSAPTVVDGHLLQIGDRILVKNQTDARENGIYVVVSSGNWQRASDHDATPANEVSTGNYVFVTTGDTQAASGWVIVGNGDTIILNVDPIEWVQFSAAISTYLAGDGISINGATISVDLDTNGGGLEFNIGKLAVKTANGIRLGTTSDVELGGSLNQTTTIDGNSGTYGLTFDQLDHFQVSFDNFLQISDSNGDVVFNMQPSEVSLQYGGRGRFTVNSNGTIVEGVQNLPLNLIGNDGSVERSKLTIAASATTFTDLRSLGQRSGIEYADDYSDDYSLRSLVDREYVDNKVSSDIIALSAITTANNGLTKSGSNVSLGGVIESIGVFLSLSGNSFVLSGNNIQASSFYVNLGDGNDSSELLNEYSPSQGQRVAMQANNGSGVIGISVVTDYNNSGESAIYASGNPVSFKGIQYDDDFSGNYVARSIPDVAFVTGLTSTSGIQTADNGLSKIGSNVQLGGLLLSDVEILGNGINLFTLGTPTDRIEFIGLYTSDGLIVDDNSSGGLLFSTLGNVVLRSNDVSIFKLASSATTFTDLRSLGQRAGIEYSDDYSSTYTSRSLVDAGYVSGLTSNIKVNKLGINIVNVNTTLDNTYHVVLVATSGSSINITLPTNPVDGQVYNIKDRSGNALTNNITISGNGKNIDGSATSLINTDYGSLYLVYSLLANEWFSLGFIS